MTPEELKEFREWRRTFEVPADSMIMKALEHIDQQAAQLAEYRRPMESMDTEQLSQWNVELSTLLCMPVSDRENLWWQIAVGDHLEKFAKSWHSSRIAELEAQVAALQEIAADQKAAHIAFVGFHRNMNEDETKNKAQDEARRQLAEKHPEAFR